MTTRAYALRCELERRSREVARAQGKIHVLRRYCGHGAAPEPEGPEVTCEVHEADCPCLGCAQWRQERTET